MTDAGCDADGPPSGLALAKAAVEALPTGTAILDGDGTIVWTNEAWEQFAVEHGLDGVSARGSNYLTAAERPDSPVAGEAVGGIGSVLAGEREAFDHEYARHTPDGQRWFRLTAYPIDGLDAPYALVQHETEERRRGRADEIDSVARILGHDLRNPLNVALERSKLIDERDADHAGEIEAALRRMEAIVEDALLLARASTVDDLQSVDVGARAERAGDGLALRLDVSEAPVVAAEESLVTQLLENLLRNAAEHAGTDGDPPTVTVGALEDGFYVRDDGPGIPRRERESVFEIGHAGETTGGSGLGLAIVERIATVHGWTVEVTDGIDGGARFEFSGVEILERSSDGAE